MSDQRIRELEREAAQGDLTARGRLLAERVRAGDLDVDDLVLAQQLGDPAALQTEGLEFDDLPPLADLLDALETRQPTWLLRALIAGVELLLPVYRTWLPTERRCEAALAATRRWLDEPTPEHARAAGEAAIEAQGAVNHTTYTMLERWRIGMITGPQRTALEYTARTAYDTADGAFRLNAGDGSPETTSLLRLDEVAQQGGWIGDGATRAAIRTALLPRILTRPA